MRETGGGSGPASRPTPIPIVGKHFPFGAIRCLNFDGSGRAKEDWLAKGIALLGELEGLQEEVSTLVDNVDDPTETKLISGAT
jgi:hypothetical protein